MRVLVTGGGTAGHVWPVLATVESLTLDEPDLDVLYVGGGGIERDLATGAGLAYRRIATGKLRRYGRWYLDPGQILANLADLVRIGWGSLQSIRIIRRFRPDVVLAKGGYVAFPVGVAAWLTRTPLVIHETDLVMGLANRILYRLASRVAVPRDRGIDPKVVETGQPIRRALMRPRPHRFFDGGDDLPTLLVTGGSQGALPINQVLAASLPELLVFTRIIHLTGEHSSEALAAAQALPEELQGRYFAARFLGDDYISALQQASLVVTRSGGAIYEMASLGVPMILIPFPYSAGDHQRANAEAFEAAGAAVMVDQSELDGRVMTELVRDLIGDPARLGEMREAARALQPPDAADRLAEVVRATAGRRRG